MRSVSIVGALGALLASSPDLANTDPLTVDQVVERNIAAVGGIDRIKALENLVYSDGLYEEGEYRGEGDASMSRGHPFFKLVGNPEDPGDYMEGYDGAAWEWFADPGIVVRTVGPASEAIRHYAGVEHPLVDYRAKGSSAELKGETTLDDRSVVVIELTRRDGFVEQFYIDTQSWSIIASSGSAPIHAFGTEVTQLTRISDYRPVGGVQIAHRFASVEMPSGKVLSSMQWGTVEANRELPAGWFLPPSFVRTPLQAFTEALYQQRADTGSMMWTYHEFRRAYPSVDTSKALNVAGYQILKMGATDEAIALLQRNAQDYPDSADSRFGLGRAFRAAGRSEEARAQFEHALKADPKHRRARAALEGLN